MACLRNMGLCPCPQCLIKKIYLPGLGTTPDEQRRARIRASDRHHTRRVRTARKFIYDEGYAVNSKAVDGVLAPEFIVPTLVRQISTVKLKSGLVDTFP